MLVARRARRQPRRGAAAASSRSSAAAAAAASGCSCSPARPRRRSACWPTSPSGSRPTAARSWASTSVFLAHRPDRRGPHRRLRRRLAGHRRDAHRRRSAAAASRSCRSPSCAARSTTSAARPPARRRRDPRRDDRTALGAGPAGARRARGGRRPAPPRDRGRAARPAGRRHAPSMRRSRRTRPWRVVMPSGCGIGGDAFWLIWDAATGRQARPQRLGAGAGRAPMPAACGPRGLTDAAAARAALDHGPGRGPLVGRRPRAGSAGCRATRSSHRPSSWHGTASRPGTGSSTRSSGPRRSVADDLGPDAGFFAVFRPHGRPWRPGERVRLPALAATLETLGARRLRRLLRGRPRRPPGARPGATPVSLDRRRPTCAAHTSTWGEPIAIDYRGVRVTTHPPNSSGVVALELLAILAPVRAARAATPSGRTA